MKRLDRVSLFDSFDTEADAKKLLARAQEVVIYIACHEVSIFGDRVTSREAESAWIPWENVKPFGSDRTILAELN